MRVHVKVVVAVEKRASFADDDSNQDKSFDGCRGTGNGGKSLVVG